MANNQYVNKVQFGNETLIDLTQDTITADKLLYGYTAHDASGALITGTLTDTGSVPTDGVQIQVPQTGTNSFWVEVPNGTLTPDPTDSDDWIRIIFSVDTNGNSNITDDIIPASGVSF